MQNPEQFLTAQSSMVSREVEQWLTETHFLIPTWKWLVLVVAFVAGIMLRPLFQYLIKKAKQVILQRWKNRRNFAFYYLQLRIQQPLAWLVVCALWRFAQDTADLTPKADHYIDHALTAMAAYFVIKLIYFAVDAVGSVLTDMVAKTESTVDDQLAPFATKTLKVLVVVLGALMILQDFGLNVMSLLAGLGLGGLALALAAQDTAANVFGSITILLDHPFKIGDWVKIQDVEGTIEEIGFRSTRIRTFYNSVIAIPNATVAKEKVDNMGARPARRIRHNLGLHYDTPTTAIQDFCDQLRQIILKKEKVMKETVTVAFNSCGDSTLNILVNFHIQVFDSNEELALQQKFLMEVLDLGKAMKVDFAYPTRTLYIPEVKSPTKYPALESPTLPTN